PTPDGYREIRPQQRGYDPRDSAQPGGKFPGRWQLDELGTRNLGERQHVFERLGRRLGVEIEHSDGFATGGLAPHRHLGDVDLMLPEQGADCTDNAGDVAVAED